MLYRDDGTLWRSPTLQRVVLVPDVSESIESSIADAANEAIGQMVARLHEAGPGCPWTIRDKAHIEYRKRGGGKNPRFFVGATHQMMAQQAQDFIEDFLRFMLRDAAHMPDSTAHAETS